MSSECFRAAFLGTMTAFGLAGVVVWLVARISLAIKDATESDYNKEQRRQ